MGAFLCFLDDFGNIHVQDGVAVQLSTGIVLPVGSGSSALPTARVRQSAQQLRPVSAAYTTTFVGGSGRNVIVSGLTPGLSGPNPPVGIFIPTIPGHYQAGQFDLEVTAPSAATISDDTDVIAVMTSGAAPTGTYTATAYGQTSYNAGGAFTLTVAPEGGTAAAIPSAALEVTAGSFPSGTMVPYDTQTYELASHPDLMIVIDNDGRAEILYLDEVVAVREDGDPWNPAGDYVATPFGELTYNPTPEPEPPPAQVDPDPDPDPTPDPDDPIPPSTGTIETDPEVLLPGTSAPDPEPDPDPEPEPDPEPGPPGQPWTAVVRLIPVNPQAGFVYAKIVETSGTMVATGGPYFGALPDNTSTDFYVPLAVSDGLGGMEQKVTGAIQWGAPTASSGGGGGAEIVVMETLEDYLALDAEVQMSGAIFVIPKEV